MTCTTSRVACLHANVSTDLNYISILFIILAWIISKLIANFPCFADVQIIIRKPKM
jgi:hypothetical protein